ncbi:hypothetical protein M3629_13195 [Paenibacillus polysaccharolyticus]|uniref:hypothetical protein n=1 Tax=Paenibacillus polysaccharolyticus TaxID=582692 RepID=UPI00203E2F9B|nr:hypothetical protein [Paenibacillus polysaccharolyticus]MCM3133746.1 hypothetical protein [Paenibacillus polysaccharolyticus]
MIRATADDVLKIVDKYSRLDIENASPMDGLRVALLDVYCRSLSQSEAREKITFKCHNLAHEDKFFDFFSDIFINDAESCFIFIQKSNSESSRKMMKAKGLDDAEIEYCFLINTGIQLCEMNCISDNNCGMERFLRVVLNAYRIIM